MAHAWGIRQMATRFFFGKESGLGSFSGRTGEVNAVPGFGIAFDDVGDEERVFSLSGDAEEGGFLLTGDTGDIRARGQGVESRGVDKDKTLFAAYESDGADPFGHLGAGRVLPFWDDAAEDFEDAERL